MGVLKAEKGLKAGQRALPSEGIKEGPSHLGCDGWSVGYQLIHGQSQKRLQKVHRGARQWREL
jgi:hypothetical protein